MISQTKNFRFTHLILLLCVGLFLASCGCEEDCASFDNFRMCSSTPSEDGCSSNSTSFSSDVTYLSVSVEITRGEPTDMISVKYYQEVDNNFVEFFSQSKALADIDDKVDGSERKVRYSVGVSRRADRLWPVGQYKVELELTQEMTPLNATQNFSIQ